MVEKEKKKSITNKDCSLSTFEEEKNDKKAIKKLKKVNKKIKLNEICSED